MSSFQDLVTDDAKYDLKSRKTEDGTDSYAAVVIGEWTIMHGTLRRFDDYGNISFGVWGRHAKIEASDLKTGSNVNQWWKDTFGDTDGSGDEPRDVHMINMGIRIYNNLKAAGEIK